MNSEPPVIMTRLIEVNILLVESNNLAPYSFKSFAYVDNVSIENVFGSDMFISGV